MARRVHPQALDRHRLLVADQAGSGHIIGYKDLADLFIANQRHTLRTGPVYLERRDDREPVIV